MIILLDGSKGAGKTSVSGLLLKQLDNSVYISLDVERRALPDKVGKGVAQQYREAFELMFRKVEDQTKLGKNVIVDCGLTAERLKRFEDLASSPNSKLYKIFLKAYYETLLSRVKQRDSSRGKDTDIERFDEVHKIIHSKDLRDFKVIETDNLTSEEVAQEILLALK